MVPIVSLWLPILLSAVFVFVASSLIHMMLGYHKADYGRASAEDQLMDAVRTLNVAPGDYLVPCPGGAQGMKDPAFLEKRKRGPNLVMTVFAPSALNMGASLLQWFVYLLVVGVFAAYVAGRALPAGTPYLRVFRFAGVTAFAAHALGLWQDTIWYKRKWTTSLRYTIDGLIYALLTGGTFGWLWPD
jgi:hypothetical protein